MKIPKVRPVKAWALVDDKNGFGGLICNSEKGLWMRVKNLTGISKSGWLRLGGRAIRVEIKPID